MVNVPGVKLRLNLLPTLAALCFKAPVLSIAPKELK